MNGKIYSLLMIGALLLSQSIFAQAKTVTGTVTSVADGAPLPGVNVLVQGTTTGTQTDFDGNYSIEAAEGDVLAFSYIGMQAQNVTVGSADTYNVSMQESASELDEVVVTALGLERQEKSLTYATQQVDTEELTQARSVNVLQGLSGKVAGLQITNSAAGVGAPSKVLLRGNRSIGGSSQPLYVVDGILLDGDISNISPDNIQEISVLKGANAAALYGSRAQNGAIIVTTKSGKGAREGVSASVAFNSMVSSPIFLMDFQNQYGQGSQGEYSQQATTSWGPRFDGRQVPHWSNDPNYPAFGSTYAYEADPDNVKNFFRLGHELTTNLSVNMNGEKTNAFFGYTFTDAGGIVPGNNLKRHGINVRINSQLTDKLSVDAKVNYIRDDNENILTTGESYDNPIRYLYKQPRNIRTQDFQHYEFVNDEGKVRQHYFLPRFNGGGNPYWVANKVLSPQLSERVIGLLSLKYDFTNDFSILARSTIDAQNRGRDEYWHNDTYTVAQFGQYTKTSENRYDWNTDILLNYNKNLSEDFKIDISAGANQRNFERNVLVGTGSNFTIENFFALSNTQDPTALEYIGNPNNGYRKFEVQSVYGLAEFSYKNALFLNLTARNDWSSTLPEANRSYFYPSAGVTAVVSDLFEFGSGFSYLKLRANWAEVGNDTSPFQLSRRADISFGTLQVNPTNPNPDLRPETTESTELGFDARFLDNRISLGFTWYKTNTFDQIFPTPRPVASGIAQQFENGGDIQNRGIEVALGAAIVQTENFRWDLDINWSRNISEVLAILPGFERYTVNRDFIREYVLEEGGQFGDVYSRGFQRDDQGRVLIDANGQPLITPGRNEVLVSNFNPDWLGGVRNSFRYKNFNLSALIDIRQGGTVTSFTEAILAADGLLDYTLEGREQDVVFGQDIFPNETAVLADGGAPNTIAVSSEDFWNTVGGRNTPVGEAFIRDASNIRLRELVLGYTFPSAFLDKTFFTSANISLVGRNLFFLQNKAENFDPELVNSTANTQEGREAFNPPTTRTVGVSFNFGF
jgi:TonB-linked SusC/RagA family outer membrane protein